MNRVTGRYITTQSHHEKVNAFVPFPLPPTKPELEPHVWQEQNTRAELALARLSGMSGLVASGEWLIYSALRREALLTSQLEGTQATLTDVFDEEAGLSVANADDVEEVTQYLQAFRYVREQINSPEGLPVSVRLLTEAHKVLLNGIRGANKQPGNIRTSQNWIGGTRPGNAVYVPPPPEEVTNLLSDLELFIHDKNQTLPPLVKIALVHAQFETIHPFLDGNGRIGRLLIAILLEEWGVLPEPLLYVSGYLKSHQEEYYRCLSEIRSDGNWEQWITFFLEGVEIAAEEAQKSIIQIASLIAMHRKRLLANASTSLPTMRLFELLPVMPRLTVERAQAELSVTFPTASAAIKVLEATDILVETTGRARGKSYVYKDYVDLLRNE
ncbi:Fic family protein [Pantoea cypripedii]|uniref:Protein adenylyltransferase n=1 Tax=Pantoea cypripedii TaxID=55209 RepID=A0A1X1EN23_PANCY|nr:Fic family protein [Pantoea cypripedii]MBP2199236.1 Fic family protein [Pantoea cypripedii]ORM90164.1 cell filamentation protein Fic [Pantoea cypripedii]